MTGVSSPLDTYQHLFEKNIVIKPFFKLGRTAAELLHDTANLTMLISVLVSELKTSHQALPLTKNQARHLQASVKTIENHLLSLSALQLQAQRQLQNAPQITQPSFKVLPLLKKILRQAQSRAQKHAIVLQFFAAIPRQLRIAGSSAQLERVLTNLFNNAIEAINSSDQNNPVSVPPTITCSTSLNKSTLTISITDTGPGIPISNLPFVTQPLFTTKAAGTGLGLAGAATSIEQNFGGKLDVSSAESSHQGCTVAITLPVL